VPHQKSTQLISSITLFGGLCIRGVHFLASSFTLVSYVRCVLLHKYSCGCAGAVTKKLVLSTKKRSDKVDFPILGFLNIKLIEVKK
jgi:hypothetical protein